MLILYCSINDLEQAAAIFRPYAILNWCYISEMHQLQTLCDHITRFLDTKNHLGG